VPNAAKRRSILALALSKNGNAVSVSVESGRSPVLKSNVGSVVNGPTPATCRRSSDR